MASKSALVTSIPIPTLLSKRQQMPGGQVSKTLTQEQLTQLLKMKQLVIERQIPVTQPTSSQQLLVSQQTTQQPIGSSQPIGLQYASVEPSINILNKMWYLISTISFSHHHHYNIGRKDLPLVSFHLSQCIINMSSSMEVGCNNNLRSI